MRQVYSCPRPAAVALMVSLLLSTGLAGAVTGGNGFYTVRVEEDPNGFGIGLYTVATGASHPGNLVDRMRAGFSLPVINDRRIDSQLAWYARHPGYMNRVMTRAAPYLHHIVNELTRREMPLELALLPIVESAFDPFA